MIAIAAAVAPVFLLIVFGAGLKRLDWPGNGLWAPAEKLVYYVLFPALLFRTLAHANLTALPVKPMASVLVLAALVMAGLLLALRPALRPPNAAFTSMVQGSIRFNTYLGVAIAAAVFGGRGVTLAAVFLAVMVPLGNALSVAALAWYGQSQRAPGLRVLIELARNPLVIACVLGAAAAIFGVRPPRWIDATLEILARASLPLGLLCVGAGLDLTAIRVGAPLIAFACALKLAIMPLLTWGFAEIAGFGGLAAVVAILFNALPAAPSSFVLARQMGGDAELMAGILTAQTALAIVTLPLLLAWLT